MSQDNVGYCPALSGAKEVEGHFLDTLGKGTQPSGRALHCPWQPHTFEGQYTFLTLPRHRDPALTPAQVTLQCQVGHWSSLHYRRMW